MIWLLKSKKQGNGKKIEKGYKAVKSMFGGAAGSFWSGAMKLCRCLFALCFGDVCVSFLSVFTWFAVVRYVISHYFKKNHSFEKIAFSYILENFWQIPWFWISNRGKIVFCLVFLKNSEFWYEKSHIFCLCVKFCRFFREKNMGFWDTP